MKKSQIIITLALATLLCACQARAQSHAHLQIGATNTAQGTPLYFYNGADFAGTSGYVKTLLFTNGGNYAGYYHGNITFTVQAATTNYAGPEPDAPALGSYLKAKILSVKGPVGGAFAFWESGATNPSISLVTGETGTSSFNVTQTDGSPGTDPFGHIHGRRFTATQPGIYTVAFQSFDASSNGVADGPIHTASEPIEINFQAGINISSITSTNNGIAVTYGSITNLNFWLESSANPNNSNGWSEVAGPLPGTDYFESLADTNIAGAQKFYRVKAATP